MGNTPADQFLDAFNDIEGWLQSILQEDATGFAELVRMRAGQTFGPVRTHEDELLQFAKLRNAIVHGDRESGELIADPRPDVVEKICRIRDTILDPPSVIPKFRGDVTTVSDEAPLSRVVRKMQERNYSQVRDGIPWATAEAKDAVHEIVRRVRDDGKTLLLVVDEIEVLEADLLSPLQVAGDAGVRLFLTGTPEGKRRVAEIRGTLDSRLRYYEGIDPFSPDDVAEYAARSLAHFRGEPYEGQAPDLFTRAAIEDIHERTAGNPREVRIECRELFTRAAFVWYRTGQDIARIQITPELRHRRFGMGR
mgnify:CR=1 FL=1